MKRIETHELQLSEVYETYETFSYIKCMVVYNKFLNKDTFFFEHLVQRDMSFILYILYVLKEKYYNIFLYPHVITTTIFRIFRKICWSIYIIM